MTKKKVKARRLRAATVVEIHQELDRTVLTRLPFDVRANLPEGELLRITFREHDEFYFKVFYGDGSRGCRTEESPGMTFVEVEEYSSMSFSQCKGRIRPWVARIIEELARGDGGGPDFISRLRDDVEAFADGMEDPEEPFSAEEARQWEGKLDAFFAEVEKLREEQEISQREIGQLKRELEDLKKQATVMPKRTFVKAAGGRFITFLERIANSKVGKVLAEAAAKGLIGPGSG